MKIGVTGATGQLGSIIIQALKEKISADQIVALVRTPQKAESFGVAVRSLDYSKPGEITAALKGIDKLMLISSSEIGKRAEQHANVIEAAKISGIKEIVYTSLLRADTSTLGLAGEHLATEKMIKDSGIPYTFLRNGWYTENFAGFIAQATQHGVLYGCSGKGKVSAAARNDFAYAAAAVLIDQGHQGKTYELAGDAAFTMSELAGEISQFTGKNIIYKNLSAEEFIGVLVNSGMPEGFAQFFAGTHISTEKGDLFDEGHQLSKLIGRPTTPLLQTIAELLKENK